MHPILNIAVSAALKAGKVILRGLDRVGSLNVTIKHHYDAVTEIDKLSELEIINIIRKAYPDHSILAEESGLTKGNNSDYEWIIDPLDGTANFMHSFPHFAVSIGLKYKNRIDHAVIYDPLRNELFTASRGKGAHLNDRRIRVSNYKELHGAFLGTGFPFRNLTIFEDYLKTFKALTPTAAGIRRAGSAALDLAYVACGRFDGFWEFSLGPWDIAAGSLLVQESGGLISDFDGSENHLKTGNVVAGNPKVFKELLKVIKTSLD